MKKTNKNEKIALKFLQIALKVSKSVLKSPDTLLKNANFVIENNEVLFKIMINSQTTDDVVNKVNDENLKIDKNIVSEWESFDKKVANFSDLTEKQIENLNSAIYQNNQANSLKEKNFVIQDNQSSENVIENDNLPQNASTLSSNLNEIVANEQKSLKKSKKQTFLGEKQSFDKQDNTSKVVDFPATDTILATSSGDRLLLPVLDRVDINPYIEESGQNDVLRGNFVDSIRADLSHK